MFFPHDRSIRYIEEKGTVGYGMGLGIILLDDTYPAFPGDVRNPSAYPYPIQYEVAEGLDIAELVTNPENPVHLDSVLRAARKLERMGCKAILGECGYFVWFQEAVAAAVKIPVFMSSLLQIPWAQSVIGKDRVVGLLMSMKKSLQQRHLDCAGVVTGSNYVVGGAMDRGKCTQFTTLWGFDAGKASLRKAEYGKAEEEFVGEGVAFFNEHPNMGAMVLECTGFPPFARALQREIGIPVFSWGTLMDFAFSVCVHRDYYGHI